MNLADYKNIWVFIETECGKPKTKQAGKIPPAIHT